MTFSLLGNRLATQATQAILRPRFGSHTHRVATTVGRTFSTDRPSEPDHNCEKPIALQRSFSSSSQDPLPQPKRTQPEGANDPLRFVSSLKNPIVHQLWMARGQAKATAEEQRVCLDLDSPRTPSQSETKISYRFSEDAFLQEAYRNPWGQMRFGKILEDLDALAGNIAFAHVQDPRTIIVTASVDRIRMKQGIRPVQVDQHLSGKVTYVGTSSMEIRMNCTDNDGNEWMEAYFTFVATDPLTKRPDRIPPLQPETEEEKKEFERAALRAQHKKEARQLKKKGVPIDPQIEATATKLLKEAGPLLNMPSLANPHQILVSQTALQSIEIAQPQARNMANQIFGGFLMRRACELAWATAYAFGGSRPSFFEVDQVQFSVPVHVGDLLNFHARILYTTTVDDPESIGPDFFPKQDALEPSVVHLVSVEVEAWIVDPSQASAKLSNQFYFTFALSSSDQSKQMRQVLPSNMEEARTMALRMAADQVQAASDNQP